MKANEELTKVGFEKIQDELIIESIKNKLDVVPASDLLRHVLQEVERLEELVEEQKEELDEYKASPFYL